MPDRRLGQSCLVRELKGRSVKESQREVKPLICSGGFRGTKPPNITSPFPLSRGRGIKGDGVVKQSLEHTVGKLKTEEVDDDQANSCKLKG